MAIILTILVKLLINGYYINYFGTYIKSFTNLLLTSESSIMKKKKILLNITVWNDYVKKEVGLEGLETEGGHIDSMYIFQPQFQTISIPLFSL